MNSASPPTASSERPDAPNSRWSRVRGWWADSRLRSRWDDIVDTLYESAPSAIALMRTAVVVIAPFAALYVTMTLLLAWVEAATATPDRTGLLAVLTEPVRTYLDGQAAALPISGETAYRAWQFSGCAAFLLAACRRGSGRAIWGLWGAASVAMVWMGTPETGRAAAAGIAVFAWSAAATVAWRGLRLRRPAGEIHLPEPRIDVHLHQSPSVLTPYRVDSRSTWLN